MKQKDGYIDYLFGVPIISAPKSKLLEEITGHLASRRSLKVICTPNPEQIVQSWSHPQFLAQLQAADWNLPDGQGIVWALNRRVSHKIQRLAGRELLHDLLQLAARNHWKIFLLGGRPGSAAAVAQRYNAAFDAGAMDIRHETVVEEKRVLAKIEEAKPDLLFVAYGAPWQEHWIFTHRHSLEAAGVGIAMAVGGSFEYEAGMVAPISPWVERWHLEWLQRLLREPWRARRQLIGLQFFWRVINGK